mgnify:CR=1 FL=1
METFVTLLIPALLAVILVRLLLLPVIAIHSACGFLCLWLLNTVSFCTGISFPMNAVTVLIAGFLGLPGMGLMAVLAVL